VILKKKFPELCMKKWMEGKCFPFFNKRKTLFLITLLFSVWLEFSFFLLFFLYYCQTWKNKNLQSNTAQTFSELIVKKKKKHQWIWLYRKKYWRSIFYVSAFFNSIT
jgi:hypothetical protein